MHKEMKRYSVKSMKNDRKNFEKREKKGNLWFIFHKGYVRIFLWKSGAAIFRVLKNAKEKDFLRKNDLGKVLKMN